VSVIVVVGDVAGRVNGSGGIGPAGFAATVATAAAAAGSRVELVTRIGEDEAGDAVVLGLARAGIGHAATLRDAGRGTPIMTSSDDEAPPDVTDDASGSGVMPPGPTLEAADVGLALRYLSDYRVIVVTHPSADDVLAEAIAAAGWSGAHLIVITSAEGEIGVPAEAIAVAAEPGAEAVADRVGRYAAAVDSGGDLDTAYAVLTGANAES